MTDFTNSGFQDEEYAFPLDAIENARVLHFGMTKREYIATQIATAIVAHSLSSNSPARVEIAVELADDLIKALKKPTH